MQTAFAYKKRKFYECQSDKKVSVSSKNVGSKNKTKSKSSKSNTVPEYTAQVSDFAGSTARFVAKRNYVLNNKINTENLHAGEAHIENSGTYLTIQGLEWALAIAPQKKRASLYSSNPDLNEIPMFCLSQQTN